MGSSAPYVYNAIRTHDPKSPQKPFDPKAVTRASQTPKPPRKKQEGPLVSFNQHPDSFLILPYGNTNPILMSPSIKVWVKWMRIIQLVLRCLQILCAGALLAFMIMIRGMDEATGWMMRIAPGVAILHTCYAIYHLARRSSGRTPASSASYMIFASLFDVSIIPFYAFSALVAYNHQTTMGTWTIILSDQSLTFTFSKIVFLVATSGGGLHLVSLAIGLYLAVTFRKITNLPPDMNPLEDNLTSRHGHKRNKSSIYTESTGSGNRMSTATTAVSEKRLSDPLENKRSSGAVYEDLSRPPTIPFFHTRTQSSDSVSTYKSTPPGSRDSRVDLPSRQYQALRNTNGPSNKDLKRSSMYAGPLPSTPPKRQSYQEIPLSDTSSPTKSSNRKSGNMSQGWYVSDSLGKRHRSASPKKEGRGSYAPIAQPYDSSDDISSHPTNPLAANPLTPRHSHNPSYTSNNYTYKSPSHELPGSPVSPVKTGDIADMSAERDEAASNFKSKYYGDLKPATPPVMVGKGREVSSGNDFLNQKGKFRVRDASGKIAEEGRSGWATRYRKVTGT
ncbi:hypothetical protein HYFRA_00002686 [Hymenoscyphus fraxineus]|uniref:Uncharacterized protein n=1 Tax=Hymenoscyphus fraxineus TaxID=746836 RepID=A0A9N9LAQ7_9HELO|nr:hypothetical protein HYFRA_00002686 [Hymenoscyphus fraxineus]